MTSPEMLAHLRDLAGRAKRTGFFCYSEFLAESDLDAALTVAREAGVPAAVWGGADFAERKMVRWGEENSFGDSAFPLGILHFFPRGDKFAEPMTHRDYLGAILGLGIERSAVGDIWLLGKEAYAAVSLPLCDFVCSSLSSVGRVATRAEQVEAPPPELAPRTEDLHVTVASLRLDAVLARLWGLSREDSQDLFLHGGVACLGRPVSKCTYVPKDGDVISVRGYGKFVFLGVVGETKKGRLAVALRKYV